MGLSARARALLLLALVAGSGLALYAPITNLTLAVRLLTAMRTLASGATGQDLAVEEEIVKQRMGDRMLEGIVYHAGKSHPERAVVLIAGVSELGCYHPRLMALARTLADKGFLVLTPDIQMFRKFQISPAAPDEIAFWYSRLPHLPAADKVQRTGMIGISFSGTLALMVAARREIRDSVAFVLAIGPYHDLFAVSRRWFTSLPATAGEGQYPVRYYGRWIMMLHALDMVASEQDRKALHDELWGLLLKGSAPPTDTKLSAQGERWRRLATMREDESDVELAHAIEEHLSYLYHKISPEQVLADVRCPVFLVHGATDDLFQAVESERLHARIRRSHLLVTPFLTHTHPFQKEMTWKQKASAFWNMLAFFYSFASAAR
jgi:pimeloyl-ACP methyl ester carboxylesterase